MTNITVAIPVYNVEPYIKECLESVMNQTMTDGVECIVIDDCGSDKSIEIAESMIAEYKGNIKFKMLHHEKNKGLSCGRNTGLDAAEGEYIYYIDSDDYIKNDCLENLWTLAKKYPKAEVVYGVEYALEQKQNDDFHLCITKFHMPEYSEDVDFIRREAILNHFSIHVGNGLYKTNFLRDNHIKFVEGIIFEDIPWKMDVARKLSAIAFCGKDTYFYRQHGSSIMGSMNPKYLTSVAIGSDHMLDNLTFGKTYKIELMRIIEFMHIYDEKFSKSPLDQMKYGKNKVFSKLYNIMYKPSGVFGKIEKKILINLFRYQMQHKS